MNIKIILKAIVAGLAAGSFFMVIFPAFLIYINISNNLFVFENSILFYIGLFLIFFPSIYFWYCTSLFSKFGKGTPAPIEPPKNLVVEGVYKYSRNPMYLCYFSIILGGFFMLGFILLLYYFIFIVLLVNIYVIFFEEPKLVERFGEEYLNYKKRVPRWFLF